MSTLRTILFPYYLITSCKSATISVKQEEHGQTFSKSDITHPGHYLNVPFHSHYLFIIPEFCMITLNTIHSLLSDPVIN